MGSGEVGRSATAKVKPQTRTAKTRQRLEIHRLRPRSVWRRLRVITGATEVFSCSEAVGSSIALTDAIKQYPSPGMVWMKRGRSFVSQRHPHLPNGLLNGVTFIAPVLPAVRAGFLVRGAWPSVGALRSPHLFRGLPTQFPKCSSSTDEKISSSLDSGGKRGLSAHPWLNPQRRSRDAQASVAASPSRSTRPPSSVTIRAVPPTNNPPTPICP